MAAVPTAQLPRDLLRLLMQRPDLLLTHVQGYIQVFRQDGSLLVSFWRRKLLCYTVALMLIAVGLALAGVATMLWAVVPETAQWILLVVPVAMFFMSLVFWLAARAGGESPGFAQCASEWESDQLMLYPGFTEP
jgi:cytochrome c biogenesis factor